MLPTTAGGYLITVGKQGIVWGGLILLKHFPEGARHFFFPLVSSFMADMRLLKVVLSSSTIVSLPFPN